MDFKFSLDQLPVGEEARIAAVAGRGPFRRRLLELGLLPGTPIRRVGQAPLGDPLSFRVRGAVICLRRAEAATIGLHPDEAALAAK
jgi:ferrous iron transport protein A